MNLLRLPSGSCPASGTGIAEDEFVFVLEGEVVLVSDAGEELLRPGDCAGFKAGIKDGSHHLQNLSSRDAVVLEVGSRRVAEDEGEYPDTTLRSSRGRGTPTWTARPTPPLG